MKCFTVFELEIHDLIPVVNNGIGIDGKLAIIADGICFPKPDMSVVNETSAIHPFSPEHAPIIMRADFFQYKDPQTGIRNTPVIIKETSGDNGWALVVWIVKNSGTNYFSNIWASYDALPIIGPQLCRDYVQYLFVMANGGSDIMVKPKNLCLNLHYSSGILKIDKA